MIQKQDIIYISTIDWDFIWQGHQEIASQLASAGNRILFIENTGVRSPGIHDFGRLKKRLFNWFHSFRGFRKVNEHLYLYSPVLLPFPYSRPITWLNAFILRQTLRRWNKLMRFENPIVITYLPTPLVATLVPTINPQLFIYYCIDSFENSSAKASKILRSEQKIFSMADIVFVTSHKLMDKAQQWNAECYLVPFGVSLKNFKVEPLSFKDIEAIPQPRIGYVGGIHKWIDFDLLRKVIRSLPEYSFVFIGPRQTDISEIENHPNVYLLGKKDHTDLPHYISQFDTCIIPYLKTDYTENVYPTKLNEYLYWGKPVVATDLAEIRYFERDYPGVVTIADNPEKFAQALSQTISAPQTDTQFAHRRSIATANSWENKIEFMNDKIETALNRKNSELETNWLRYFAKNYYQFRYKTLILAAWIVFFIYLVFFTPLFWYLARPLKKGDLPKPADVIVVFAGGVGESGEAGQGYEERVQTAVQLFHQGYARHLIFSSGFMYVFKEPLVMKSLAIALGVPDSLILLDDKASNTIQNVQNSYKLTQKFGWRQIILISSPYHMKRVELVALRHAPEWEITWTPPSHGGYYAHRESWLPLFQQKIQLHQIEGILHEYASIIYYWWNGQL